MITIHKAILHILDLASGTSVPSQRLINPDNTVANAYLARTVERSFTSATAQAGVLQSGTFFAGAISGYASGQLDFISLSHQLAERTWDILGRSAKAEATDFVLVDFEREGQHGLALFLLYNKNAFTHYVYQQGGETWTDIIRHQGLLPSGSQKVETYAVIDPQTGTVLFADRKAEVDGQEVYILPQLLLECSSAPSSKAALEIVEQAAVQVAETHGQNPVMAASRAKATVGEAVMAEKPISPEEMAQELFEGSEVMQREFAQKTKEAGLAGEVRVNPNYAMRKSRTHKIKTDTGIELTIPVEYYQNPEFVEFINNPDGSIAIALKNINQIIN